MTLALVSAISLSAGQVLANALDYHLDFNSLRPGENYTEEELKADLRVANGIGFADDRVNPTEATNRASVDPSMGLGGTGSSLKVKFPKGQLKTANSGVDTRIPIQGSYKTNFFRAQDLYLSYWVRFSDNFDFTRCGGKLPSLGGDYALDGLRWKGRIMWRKGGSIQFYPELKGNEDSFDSDSDRFWGESIVKKGSICDDEYTPYLKTGTWHNIELHYKFESPGKNDGFFEGWVDGGKGHKVTPSEKFGHWLPANPADDININYILLSTFLGGSEVSDYGMAEDTYAWFDDFKVSTQRIDEYGKSITSPILASDPVAQAVRGLSMDWKSGLIRLSNPGSWKVFDSSGKPIANGRGESVDLAGFAHGIYLVKTGGKVLRVVR